MRKKFSIKKIKLVFIGILVGSTGLLFLTSARINYFEINKQLDIFANLFREVSTYYVEDTEPGDLMNDAIENMLKELDPYTVYIPETDIENYRMMQTGQYGGIGASIMKQGDKVVISSPRKGFSADKAGLRAGDILINAEGKELTGMSTDDVSRILKGSPGTEVQLTYSRYGVEKTITLKREKIQLKSVPYYGMINENTGYIVLTSFTDKASADVSAAFNDLKKNNNLKSLVFDLRGNPGGLLSEAVNVTNVFVAKGQKVVETKGRMKQTNNVYKTLRKPIDIAIPVAVLINDQSASASEIVAGTIQDLDRGVIVGQRSYGKGLVQQTRPLSYGSQVKITIAKYYTPSGRCIQAINYAERNKDGTVKRMPDSLRTEFKTANGRAVFDGGGVDPDLSLEEESYPRILLSLVSKQLIFNYVTDFVKDNPTIVAAGEFRLSDDQYKDFVKYLDDKDYDYVTDTEKIFKKLKEVSEKENYDEISENIAGLNKKFQEHKHEDLMRFKPAIRAFMEEEIASRYYYDEGRIRQRIISDPQVKAAADLLNNSTQYNQLLTVVD